MPRKRIKLSNGNYLELKDGYLYRAISAQELKDIQKLGKVTARNENNRLYFTNDANFSRALAVDGSKYVIRVRADNVGNIAHDPHVPSTVPSVYGSKDLPIDLIQIQGNAGEYVKFVRAKGGGFVPNEKTKGVGINGRNELNEREVLKLYQKAEDKLLAIIAKGDPTQRFTIYRAQQLRAIREVMRELDGDVRKYVEKKIPELTEAGFKDTLHKIEQLGETRFKFEFSGIDREAIRVLTEKAYLNFGKNMQGMGATAQEASMNRIAIQSEVISGTIQGSSFATSTQDVLDIMKDNGLTGFQSRGGKQFKALPYANMLVRTQNIFAYNHGARNRLLGAGRRYAIFPTIRPDIDGEDICNAWERKKFIDLLIDPIPPESTHPNCRHTIQPVSFAQLEEEAPDLYQKAIAHFESIAGFKP